MMIFYIYVIMSTLLKLCLSGYDVKPCFCASDKIPFIFEENILMAPDTYAENPYSRSFLGFFGGGGCTVRPAGS